MGTRARYGVAVVAGFALSLMASVAMADGPSLDHAREALRAGNARQAYEELSKMDDLVGQPEYDYLLGVAALDSGRLEEAIIAFERVLAVMPNHAGAQMDLARAYYATGSFDLAEAAFLRLRGANPPPAAQEAISRYLEAIKARKQQTQAGWIGFGEVGIGYDSNLTGVPTDFGAAAQQSFAISGIQPTGNSIKRDAPFAQAAVGAEYSQPFSRGWSLFAGGEARGRAYHDESLFNTTTGDVHGGAALNDGQSQYRATASYLAFNQEGDAPGDPRPTNDRRMASLALDYRFALAPKTQLGATVQASRVRFPDNPVEDFNQLYVAASWLHSFDRKGVPLLYLAAFATDDHAPNKLPASDTTKSKNLAGLRSYVQYSIDSKLLVFNGLAFIYRRDKDPFARSTEIEHGRDRYGEISVGAAWQFRPKCALRLQYVYSRNTSNIDIYDYDRHEVSTNVRCDIF